MNVKLASKQHKKRQVNAHSTIKNVHIWPPLIPHPGSAAVDDPYNPPKVPHPEYAKAIDDPYNPPKIPHPGAKEVDDPYNPPKIPHPSH